MPPKKGAKQPCRYFQQGKCQKGDGCTYAHEHDPNFKKKACQFFAFDKCYRGKDCTFSHQKEDIDSLKATSRGDAGKGSSGGTTSEKLFRDWRNYISAAGESRPLGQAMTAFCKGAAELVGGETGQMQEVIIMLASQGGLQRILELTGKDFAQLTEQQLRRIFENQILPMFKAITHKNVIGSIILLPRLMTIYNILYGGDGEQAARMFGAVASILRAMTLTDPNAENAVDAESIDVVETCLIAFAKLVEVNTEAQIHHGLKLVAESLALLFEDHASPAVKFALKPAQRHLKRIEQRLGLGQALPDAAIKPGGNPSFRAVFHLSRERPSELSADGPRHDNDKIDIREISILPTLEEIQSSRNEYLPLADPREWHIGGLEGLLDRHFRLLREDTVGQLRDAARVELERLQDPDAYDRRDRRGRQGARTFVYENVLVNDVTFRSYTGMEFVLSFDQPKALRNRDPHARSDWWQNSKRLGHEALICLLSSAGSATFILILTEHSKSNKKNTDNAQPLHKRYDLWSNPERAHVIAKPVNGIDIQPLLNQLQYSGLEQLSLVEFPGVLLPAFKPTLEAMQHMSETLDVPFAHILAPLSTPANPDREIDILPPEYATRPGFRFDLSSVTDGGSRMDFMPGQLQSTMSIDLAAKSSLDPGQAHAVVSSLSRSLALIQGPPGTGKSFTGVQLIKILLLNKKAGTLGPIVTVCFTNHALDAGLERLLDEGVEQVVRIGGSSKSSKLADVNLRAVAQRLQLTKTEKSERWQLNKANEEAREINNIITSMSQVGTQESLKDLLRRQYPDHYTQLFSALDEDGFALVDYGRENIIERWLRAAPWGRNRPRTIEELQDENVHVMTGHERRGLYDHWYQEVSQDLKRRLDTALRSYNEIKAHLDDIRTELDLRVLRQANIIGITTSGLARNLELLRRIDAKVLVCEEAGEVLESHLLTALLPSMQHAILIGDHLQLRPRVQNYDLSTESKNGQQYALDVSLFERLVQPSDDLASPLSYCTLEVQRRMHPSISQLVRDTLYPRLQDAPSVSQHPEVVGMKRRLFWCHHEHPEKQGDEAGTSHSNVYEVDMVAALVKHLVSQGVYRPDEIAVITPYLGQLREIRKRLAGSYQILLNDRDIDDLDKEGIHEEDDSAGIAQRRTSVARGTLIQAMRLATVDNFQGEEAKVVVVSLVRSNKHNKPGFLKTANRINVLLSRAQHSMYVIGNANTTESVKMWADVLQIFKDDGNFGTSLELCCPRHKDTDSGQRA
ncbi:P-loop containing nucleoside triphosphate hydrolase protein [Teratosphaeria nubilosa]|uniref:P-loop containing nucleoside triphosphate hydrolase protein n=1 Tax=Teratosphaeria nubilosa TaxID=161662 RepID=A0A6G1L3X3_9PEZI|nr:P-loop containing nucleoside triphosphate hydrolase protein [Teratosphaeria nubilosa]